MKILISGFEPFGNDEWNSSWQTALQIQSAKNQTVLKVLLPVAFEKAWPVLKATIEEEKPDAVICLGQAEGRAAITIEKIGINWRQARIPDNEGFQPKGTKIEEDGADGLFSTLNVEKLVSCALKKGIPASVSYTAGTYVCNDVLYELLYWIQKENRSIQAGFIHLPLLPMQAAKRTPVLPSMSLEEMRTGLQSIIEAVES